MFVFIIQNQNQRRLWTSYAGNCVEHGSIYFIKCIWCIRCNSIIQLQLYLRRTIRHFAISHYQQSNGDQVDQLIKNIRDELEKKNTYSTIRRIVMNHLPGKLLSQHFYIQ